MHLTPVDLHGEAAAARASAGAGDSVLPPCSKGLGFRVEGC